MANPPHNDHDKPTAHGPTPPASPYSTPAENPPAVPPHAGSPKSAKLFGLIHRLAHTLDADDLALLNALYTEILAAEPKPAPTVAVAPDTGPKSSKEV